MLEFQKYVPEGIEPGAPVIMLLHGRGADMRDLLGLQRYLPQRAVLILPQARFPAAPWGYGTGWAWYRFLGENRPEPESFEASIRDLEELIEALPDALSWTPGPLVMGGFSQGGTCSLACALRRPGRVRFVLNFSGFLADHPSVRVTPETVRGTAFFWGHGTHDPNIPFSLAEQGRAALRAAGAKLEARDYAIGHWIEPQELRDAMTWLEVELELTEHEQ